MLDWQILRDGDQVGAGTALNDVVVNKSTLARIIDIDCWVGAHYGHGFRADGLIIATPTGSTAYNLSAGGPIIAPGTDAISICPNLSAHADESTACPSVHAEISLHVNTREQEVMFTATGRQVCR